jgi:ABC-2 type transport system permease protein
MRPRRIASDLKIFSLSYLRNPVGLFFTLIFPVILIGIFGFIFSVGQSTVTLYTVNLDHNSNVSEAYMADLNRTGAVQVHEVNVSGSLSDYLTANGDTVGLIIPEGFQARVLAHQPVNLTVIVDPQDAATSGIVVGAINGVNSEVNLQAASGTPFVGFSTQNVGSPVFTYIDYLVPGLIGFTILTSPMFSMVELSSSYRKDKLFRQLSLTPLTKGEWLTAKVIWYVGMTFATAGIMLATGILAFHAHLQITLGLVPFLILGPFFFVSLGMLCGSVARTPDTAALIGNVVTFPMMFLSGTFFPVNSFPSYLQAFAHILPLYYVIDGMNQALLYQHYGMSFLTDLLVILAGGLVVFVLAILTFRWRDE